MSGDFAPTTAARDRSAGDDAPMLSVVTCVLNEQDIVADLCHRIVKACRPLGVPFEIVIVNDGSKDDTLPRLITLSRELPELRVIDLTRNFGHMPALTSGLMAARGHAVVVMDGDLQDPPELIPQFYERWQAGADVVYGLRTQRNESRLKRIGTAAFYWLLDKVSETEIPKQVGTYGLMDRRVVETLNALPERQRFFAGLRAWVGGKSDFVPYARPDRPCGDSRVGFGGLFRLARTAVFSFSKVPLRLASLFSLSCGLILFLVGLTAIAIRLLTQMAIPGWATYTTMLGMIGFVQSVVLAVLSEYIAIIFDEIKGRPIFLVREEFTRGRCVRGRSAGSPDDRIETGDAAAVAAGLNELVDLLRQARSVDLIPDPSRSASPAASTRDAGEPVE